MKTIFAFLAGLAMAGAVLSPAHARELRIAVAANFLDAAKEIGARFAARTGARPLFSSGATGQLYAQISQGAPFDVFLAADRARPAKAIAEKLAAPGSRFTYATGRLVLFSRIGGLVEGEDTLARKYFARLAIANPKTAPYGAAAVETMKALGVYDRLTAKLVRGNSIAQTYQFVYTGNAELGFVALSQVAGHNEGSRWIVPQSLHAPIAQDAVLLNRGAANDAARAFLAFLREPAARAIIRRHGYDAGK